MSRKAILDGTVSFEPNWPTEFSRKFIRRIFYARNFENVSAAAESPLTGGHDCCCCCMLRGRFRSADEGVRGGACAGVLVPGGSSTEIELSQGATSIFLSALAARNQHSCTIIKVGNNVLHKNYSNSQREVFRRSPRESCDTPVYFIYFEQYNRCSVAPYSTCWRCVL